MKRALRITILLVVGAFILHAEAAACSLFVARFEVAESFRVRVLHGGRPKQGIVVEVKLGLGGRVLRKGISDVAGIVQVEGLLPGNYDLEIGSNTRFGNFAEISVNTRAKDPESKTVSLDWIGHRLILRVGRFHGELRQGSSHDASAPSKILPNIDITVREATSGIVRFTGRTDSVGQFDAGLSPGVYEVEIKPRSVVMKNSTHALSPGGVSPLR